ncbi:MAG: transcription-repair coupling factor [Phycisphaerales bacterium]
MTTGPEHQVAQRDRRGTRARTPSAPALLELVAIDPAVARLAERLAAGARIVGAGASGSSAALVAGAIARHSDRPVVFVIAHLDEADNAADELRAAGVPAERFPALEVLPGETNVSLDCVGERLHAVRTASAGGYSGAGVLLCPIQALMQPVPAPERLDDLSLRLALGDARGRDAIVRWLDQAGYERVDAIEEPGHFAIRGGILDVFPAGADAPPARLDFFGDELESLHEIDLDTMGSDRALERVDLISAPAGAPDAGAGGVCLLDLLPRDCVAVLHETMEIVEQARGYYERARDASTIFGPPAILKRLRENFTGFAELNAFSPAAPDAEVVNLPADTLPTFAGDAAKAVEELAELANHYRVVVCCENAGESQRFEELRAEFAPDAPIEHLETYLHRGFLWGEPRDGSKPAALVPYHELLHRYQTRRRIRRVRTGRAMDAFLDLKEGDYVVHLDHGVAKFAGLKMMKPRSDAARSKKRIADAEEEYLTLEFAGRALLHVPAAQIDKVQKYIGGSRATPKLSTLGGKQWKKQKEKVAEATRDLAAEMLRVQAAREAMPGVRYPADTAWQREFEAEFPYEETEDQLAAIAEAKKDMTSPRPMDRLICGDVGFGKTEVAMRAAFKAAEFGKQVAVLVPTTVLAEQHERTFRERLAGYPFRVEAISRFKTGEQTKKTLAALGRGEVDVIIGTHRLLSKDVRFSDLGLVIIDEEQRFGVEHKQRLLQLRTEADILTLSATPIPRTLHMSLLGLRDISNLTTAPMDRRAIVTEVIPYNETRIKRAIERELAREGQVFFVHNRVQSIRRIADEVQALAPTARIVVGHGQMPPGELEKVMLTFVRGQADILVSTTIIESGIDIPTANTMIIDDADRFGLADLHQLRGRVGRHKHRAYCYLLLPRTRTVSSTAKKRLKAIEEYSMLGAGFKIAMRDLEIRGAGNLLGAEQSGHIATVGYELYCRLLEDAVRDLKQESTHKPLETAVEIGVAGTLPRPYIPSDLRRMEAYRRLSTARAQEDLDALERDMEAAYGKPPAAAQRLIDLARIRVGLSLIEVGAVTVFEKDVIFRTYHPARVMQKLEGAQGTVRPVSPRAPGEPHEVYFRPPPSYLEPETLLAVLRRRFVGSPQDAAAG